MVNVGHRFVYPAKAGYERATRHIKEMTLLTAGQRVLQHCFRGIIVDGSNMTDKTTDTAQDEFLDRALEAFDAGGIGAAVAALDATGNSIETGARFDGLARRLYSSRKDVANMMAVAESGIAFCRDRAAHAESAEAAKQLKAVAKTIAFNAGANCWPGWGDEGVDITSADIQSGLTFAKLSRDLVRELQLGPKQEATGAWLIGALQLAAGEPAAALVAFGAARDLAASSGEGARILMADGYCALARRADMAAPPADAEELQAVLSRLRELGSDEARFFADQLVTAARILGGRGVPADGSA